MKVLVGCEYSGVVRDAFIALGHDAWSCDFEETETPGNHYRGDVKDIINDGWDLGIFHPPCTFLASSGVRWLSHPDDTHLPFNERRVHPQYPNRRIDMQESINFVKMLYDAPIPMVAIENPIGLLSTRWRKPDQIIQPWQFGHQKMKSTCLWLKNLPVLTPTNIVGPPPTDKKERLKWQDVWMASPGPDRWKDRSRTYTGFGKAMAQQWGNTLS